MERSTFYYVAGDVSWGTAGSTTFGKTKWDTESQEGVPDESCGKDELQSERFAAESVVGTYSQTPANGVVTYPIDIGDKVATRERNVF